MSYESESLFYKYQHLTDTLSTSSICSTTKHGKGALVSRDALLIFTHPGACMQPMELHLCPQPLKVYCNSQHAVLAVQHRETVQITSSGTSIHNLLQSVYQELQTQENQLVLHILSHIIIFQSLCLK